MIDLELLVLSLMQRSLPDTKIRLEHEPGEINDFPLVLLGVIGGSSVANADGRPSAWTMTLTVAVAALSKEQAVDLMRDVYEAVWSWQIGQWSGANRVEGLGAVVDIDDASAPTLVASPDVEGARITQYAGGWSMIAAAP